MQLTVSQCKDELHIATLEGDAKTIKRILDSNIYNPSEWVYSDWLKELSSEGFLDAAEVVLDNFIKRYPDSNKNDAMISACNHAHYNIVIMLSERGLSLPINETTLRAFPKMLASERIDTEYFISMLPVNSASLLDIAYAVLCRQKNSTPLNLIDSSPQWHKPILLKLSNDSF